MQLTAKSIVLDYYPIKNGNNNILPDKFLRILSFKGETQTKRIVSTSQLDEEVRDRVDNFNYSITNNNDNIPQYINILKTLDEQLGGAL